MSIIDLGSYPGGWTQVVKESVGNKGTVVAVDIQNMREIKGTFFIHKSITELEDNDFKEFREKLPFDLVLSDMAPNMSGNRTTDQARAMHLADLALDAACRWLNPGGAMAVKLFQGAGVDAWMAEVRKHFDKARLVKPEASRSESREVYAVAQGFVPETEG